MNGLPGAIGLRQSTTTKGITTPGTNTLKKLMATLRRLMKDPHTRTERAVKRRVVSAKEWWPARRPLTINLREEAGKPAHGSGRFFLQRRAYPEGVKLFPNRQSDASMCSQRYEFLG
jgi:hypothetical protein